LAQEVGLKPTSAQGEHMERSGSGHFSAVVAKSTHVCPSHEEHGAVEETFLAFCGARADMDGKSFAKLCKDCDLVDKSLTATEVDIIFAKVVPKGYRRIDLHHFMFALALVAEKKGIDVDRVRSIVKQSGGPALHGTKTDTVRFYDEHQARAKDSLLSLKCAAAQRRGNVLLLEQDTASDMPTSGRLNSPPGSTPHISPRSSPAVSGAERSGQRCPSPRRRSPSPKIHAFAASAETTEMAPSPRPLITIRSPSPRQRCADAGGGTALPPKSPCSSPALSRERSCPPSVKPFQGPACDPQAHLSPVAVAALARPTLRGKTATVEETFRAYCGASVDMDGKTFVKLCKDCRLIEHGLTTTDLDIIFASVVPRGHRRIDEEQFRMALELVAERKGVAAASVGRAVAESGGPVLHCTKAEAVRFHDDKSTYTGTHLHGGPDCGASGARSPDQLWFASLRPESDGYPETAEPGRGGGGGSNLCAAPPVSPATSPASEPLHSQRRRLRLHSWKSRAPGDTDELTMVFTDVQGSTSLWEANPVAMEQALRVHDVAMRAAMARHGGYEVTTEGDAFEVAFKDAVDAVGFCLDVQTELLECDWPCATLEHPDASVSEDGAWKGLRVRMGLHSGRPAAVTQHEVTGRRRYAGPSVALAKAIEGACHGGQILLSATSFSHIDGLLTQLGSPQVVDLGEHVLKSPGLGGDSGAAAVHLLQLVPAAQAHNYFSCRSCVNGQLSACVGGRIFPPILSVRQTCPGFHQAPSGPLITLCFVFTKGGKDLAASDPVLAAESLGLVRSCVRGLLRTAAGGGGYECQEDEGDFMLGFACPGVAAGFAVALQRALPHLAWPTGLFARSPDFRQGLRVAIGALSGSYTSRGPHTSTGRADYFGTLVNRTARIAGAANGGQTLMGGEVAAAPPGTHFERLGAFALKGVDGPVVLHELRIRSADNRIEVFPELKTMGRMGP